MALHKPFDRSFFISGGAIMTQGRSLNLTKGQFGIFDVQSTNKDGAKAVSSFRGKPKDRLYELKLGKTDLTVTRSQNNKSYSSFPFKLSNVLDLKVSVPKNTEQKVDEVILGYNGINDDTAIKFKTGDRYKVYLELKGEPIGLLGYDNSKVTIPVYLDADTCSALKVCEDCDPCAEVDCLPIVMQAIETLKDHKLRGNVALTDYVDITPVRNCEGEAEVQEIPYSFYCLDVCDTGDTNALALVQAQYPSVKIERTGRNGAVSSYQFLQESSLDAPVEYVQTLPSLIKGCKECPSGYTEIEGGAVYAITLRNFGADMTSTIEELEGAIEGTVVRADATNNGVSYYTVLTESKLTTEQEDEFLQGLSELIFDAESTIEFLGEASAICDNSTETTVEWSECGTCNVSESQFTITLPDTECGEDRLTELQAAYPELTIAVNTNGDSEVKGGCQTQYITTVKTNLVCEECDPIFKDYYKADAPKSYDTRDWSPVVSGTTLTNCLCGIRFKGKVLEVHPDECLRDEIGFIDSSVMVRVSGGAVTEVREGIGETEDEPFNVEYISRYTRRTHLGGNLYSDEDRSMAFFTGTQRHVGDNVAKLLQGEESVLDSSKQYVDYAITIRRDTYSQSFGGRSEDNITYHILVEVGRQAPLERLLNTVGIAAGIGTVQAFGLPVQVSAPVVDGDTNGDGVVTDADA